MAAKRWVRRTPAERGRTMTTIELPPALLKRARLYAADRGITFRALVEQALRGVLAHERKGSMKHREGTP